VTSYRIHTLSNDDHLRGSPHTIHCADDTAALAVVHQLLDGHAIELWHDSRLVKRLEREHKGSP
jgi:hypothetical protein